MTESLTVGVLDLQGDVQEHCTALESCGARVIRVKTTIDLDQVQGLIIPGGESTTIGKLLSWYGLDEAIRGRSQAGMPVYGTCAGAILLAKRIEGKAQAQTLSLMDITVERNAYGRQLDSFECELEAQLGGETKLVDAVFIRAPKLKALGEGVQSLAEWRGDVVLAQQNHLLVSTFHPELTENPVIHRYFLSLIKSSLS